MISKEQLEQALNRAYKMCSIKCHNEHVRMAINNYRTLYKGKESELTKDDMEIAKEQISRKYYDMYCYECRCTPDFETLLKEINKEVKCIKQIESKD